MRTRNWTMSSLDPDEHVVYVVHKAVQTGLVQVCEQSFKHLSLIMEVKRGQYLGAQLIVLLQKKCFLVFRFTSA